MRTTPLLLALALSPTAAAWEPPTPTPTFQLQTWFTGFDQDATEQADPAGYGDPEDDVGFKIARARIGVAGGDDRFDYALTVGTTAPFDRVSHGTNDIALVGAFARGKLPLGPGELRISGGSQRVHFGREQQISSLHLLFQERSVASQWTGASYETGLVADYELDAGFRVRAGAFNGNDSPFGDDDPGLMSVVRVEYGKGEVYRTFDSEDGLGVGVSAMLNPELATNTTALGADLLGRFGPVALLVEGATVELSPGDSTVADPHVAAPTRRLGATAQASFIHPLERGGLEIGVRYSLFDDDTDASDNGDVGALHAGLTWWDAAPGIDLGAGVIHRMENGGRAIPNDTARVWAQVSWPPRRYGSDIDGDAAESVPGDAL